MIQKHTIGLLIIFLVLSACGSGSGVRRPSSQPAGATSTAACFARLDRLDGMQYKRLAPHYEGVCGYDDGVLLLDIGVPVPGLRALSCPAAESLYHWVHGGVLPAAARRFGSSVVRIQSYGTYACRTRNSQAGAKLSEHARANAVDIASFTLANGRTVSVKSGWRGDDDEQAFLSDVHKAGCDRFNVVIGPDGDKYHQDHIHLDKGAWPYCR